jgi:16S rRNA G1207 methylase RsmC
VRVVAVEPNPIRSAVCAALHASAPDVPEPGGAVLVQQSTFEQYAAGAAAEGTVFDAVVMNPPFAVSDDPHVWLEHLRLAWHLMRPGGWLVSVVPAGRGARSAPRRIAA